MYTTIIFLSLCVIEFVFLWMKWDEIQTYREVGQGAASITGLDENASYKAFVKLVGILMEYFKYFLIVPLIFIIFANLIVASILGSVLGLIF